MVLIELQPQGAVSLVSMLLYVPLAGGLPAAVGLLGPALAFLFAFLAGGWLFFRQFWSQVWAKVRQDWRWAVATGVVILGVVGGGAALWFQG